MNFKNIKKFFTLTKRYESSDYAYVRIAATRTFTNVLIMAVQSFKSGFQLTNLLPVAATTITGLLNRYLVKSDLARFTVEFGLLVGMNLILPNIIKLSKEDESYNVYQGIPTIFAALGQSLYMSISYNSLSDLYDIGEKQIERFKNMLGARGNPEELEHLNEEKDGLSNDELRRVIDLVSFNIENVKIKILPTVIRDASAGFSPFDDLNARYQNLQASMGTQANIELDLELQELSSVIRDASSEVSPLDDLNAKYQNLQANTGLPNAGPDLELQELSSHDKVNCFFKASDASVRFSYVENPKLGELKLWTAYRA